MALVGNHIACIGLCYLVIVLSAHAQTADTSTELYVQASRINVRAQGVANAAIVGHLTTNAKVRVLAKQGEWCEVESPSSPRGHTACSLLGAAPLTLTQVEQKLADQNLPPKERLDWSSRAFWIAPSLQRWATVGEAMTGALLSQEVQQQELSQMKPMRPKVAEFEAMKQLLAQGILARYAFTMPSWTSPNVVAAQARAALPKVSPSFFKRGETPFVVPTSPFGLGNAHASVFSLADALSAGKNVAIKLRILGPAYYAHNRSQAPLHLALLAPPWPAKVMPDASSGLIHVDTGYEAILGVWDVGQLSIAFAKVATLHGVTRQGKFSGLGIRELNTDFATGACMGGDLVYTAHPVQGSPRWGNEVVSWAGKAPSGAAATVRSRQFEGQTIYDKLVIHDIDVNGDGIADFSTWQGRYVPQVSAEGYWNAVFVNVDGKWVLASQEEDADCT